MNRNAVFENHKSQITRWPDEPMIRSPDRWRETSYVGRRKGGQGEILRVVYPERGEWAQNDSMKTFSRSLFTGRGSACWTASG
jgi:hypothetical protein